MNELQPGDPESIGPNRLPARIGTGGMGVILRHYSSLLAGLIPQAQSKDLSDAQGFLFRHHAAMFLCSPLGILETSRVCRSMRDQPVASQ